MHLERRQTMMPSQLIPIVVQESLTSLDEDRDSMFHVMEFFYGDGDHLGEYSEADHLLTSYGLLSPSSHRTMNASSAHTPLGRTVWHGLSTLQPDQERIRERAMLVLHAHDVDLDIMGWVETAEGLAHLVLGLALAMVGLGKGHPAAQGIKSELANARHSV